MDIQTSVSRASPKVDSDKKRGKPPSKRARGSTNDDEDPSSGLPLNANGNDNINVNAADTGHLNITYDKGDRAPYIVFIRRNVDGPNNDTRLDPISVARIVTRFANGKILEVKSAGKNKVAVHFGDYAIANRALSHPNIKEVGLNAFIPSFNILRTGVIRNVPLDISENDVVNLFSSQFKILSAKRFNIRSRKDGEITTSPSRSVLIKFRGQFLPRAVTFIHVNFPVYPYFPRVLMCFSCLRYGHVKADCKGKARCARCVMKSMLLSMTALDFGFRPTVVTAGVSTYRLPRRVPPI
ncbi:hypothetical protein ALC60_08977 [Trachymyrmex zeteki]|uniref:CCHC-type domain-containing protein n=1 Tax=Mycetomoellerius zeteki TaxID=64791 RepID=A0A151WW59_9HYME|nr:hypothetical protein ALC60_08977 [Trachymyrmex zeteki]